MIDLSREQQANKDLIEKVSALVAIDPRWAVSIALTESSLGLKQKSPTGCKGVFQMSRIAMMDMLQMMEANDEDSIDILCGVAFLSLLLKRHKSIETATSHYCDPKDRDFYWNRVKSYMQEE